MRTQEVIVCFEFNFVRISRLIGGFHKLGCRGEAIFTRISFGLKEIGNFKFYPYGTRLEVSSEVGYPYGKTRAGSIDTYKAELVA